MSQSLIVCKKKHIHSFWNCLEYDIIMDQKVFNFPNSRSDADLGFGCIRPHSEPAFLKENDVLYTYTVHEGFEY